MKTYTVEKNGQVYVRTQWPAGAYPPETERSMMKAGYEIRIDGKKKRRGKGEV